MKFYLPITAVKKVLQEKDILLEAIFVGLFLLYTRSGRETGRI